MHLGKYVFSQIVEFIPRKIFYNSINRYKGNERIRNLSCRDQFLALMFGQLANLPSLRSIVVCLNAHANSLYHLGFKLNKFQLSTLARANENRDWRIYHDLTMSLIITARQLYVNDNDFKLDLKGSVYALDSTVIDLCLNTFKWAYFELGKSAVKIHTQLDLKGNIPAFFWITKAKKHDINFLDILEFEAGAFYIMDRGYIDFERLYKINEQKAYFIIRPKDSLSFKRMYSQVVDKPTGVRCDQIIKLKQFYSKKRYPEKLRRIKYYDQETKRYYIYLTNNFEQSPQTIADLYRHRWKIELFFKWIKQHLHIEVFWGYTSNAVKIQIYAAMSSFLIVAIMKKRLKSNRNIYEILQILGVSLFEKTPINTILSESYLQNENNHEKNQLRLFDF